jgi:hypothetical protein
MIVKNTVTANFNCSLERAFKTPILGDATKFLAGYGVVPPVTGFIRDESWGKTGGSRIPMSNGNKWIPKGEMGFDEILVREENTYWKWQVTDFRFWKKVFSKAQGELFFKDNGDGTVSVKWTYTYHATNLFNYPFIVYFVRAYWKKIMRNGILVMKEHAENGKPYLYDN